MQNVSINFIIDFYMDGRDYKLRKEEMKEIFILWNFPSFSIWVVSRKKEVLSIHAIENFLNYWCRRVTGYCPPKKINFELGVHQNFKHVFCLCWSIINPYENLIRCIFIVRSLFVWGIKILEWNDWYSLFHEMREGIRN